MCAASASCPVEATLAKAREAETEALEAKIRVRDVMQGATKDAASTTITLADKAVAHARDAESKAASSSSTSPTDVSRPTDDSAKEAHLLAEKARAYAAAARAWAAHSGAIAKRESAVAALNAHRDAVSSQVRDVLDDYAAVIATLLESRTPSGSDPEMVDNTQTDSGSER